MERTDDGKGEKIMILIGAIFVILSMMFFLSAIGWLQCPQGICPSSWETQDYLQASLVLATIGFAVLRIYLQRRKIREDHEASLKRDHTRKIKERIVKPLLEEIKLIKIKDCRPCREKKWGPSHEPFFSFKLFKGEALPPETEHPELFEDFLRNHTTQAFRDNYEKFKKIAKELNEVIDDLKRKLEEFFDKEGLPVAVFEELGDEDLDRILKKEGWVVDKDSALEFFMKYIYHKIEHPTLKYVPAYANTPRRFVIEYKDNRGYWSGHLQCICDKEEIDSNKLEFIKKLLIEAQDKFAADVEPIREYVTQFEKVRNALIRELKNMELVGIYKEKCEFVRSS